MSQAIGRWLNHERPLADVTVGQIRNLSALLLVVIGLALLLAQAPLPLAAAALAGTAFALLVFVRPVWALYVLPFAVPFGSFADIQLGPATVGATEALCGLFVAAWLARSIARRSIRFEPLPLTLPLALWLASQWLSWTVTHSLAASLKETIKWLEFAALYLIAAHELQRRDLIIVVLAMLAAGALAGLQGLYQAIWRVGPDGFLFPLAGRLWLRAYGTFIQPNPYGGYLGVTLPLAYGMLATLLGLGSTSPSRHVQPIAQPLHVGLLSRSLLLAYSLLTGGLMLLALFFSLSRGAWIGATLAIIAVGILLSRRALIASLLIGAGGALLLALGAGALLPQALRERATDFLPYLGLVDIQGIPISDQNFAILERLAHWRAAFRMFEAHPWLGVGIGNYTAAYPRYQDIEFWQDPLGHAHNIYLNFAAETGLVGLVAYLMFWGATLFLAWRAVRQNTGLARGIAVGSLGALVHLAAHNFFDNLYVHGIYLQIALLLAGLAVLCRPTPLLNPHSSGPTFNGGPALE
jgi:putative inorganic carbon (HCO3(-)) transporter